MSNLGPQKIKSSYPGLLQVPGGITTTLQAVTDGSGNATPLLLSTTGVSITGLISTTAQNIYGGTAGSVVYQTGVSTTGFATAGTTGQLLSSNGVAAPTFVTVDSNYVGAVASTGDTMSGDLNMDGNLIKSVGSPISSGDAANKAYVDSVAVGLQPKTAARVATTANLGILSGLLTIDGVTVVAGDRVLVKDQTLSQFNGVYIASSTTWLRSTDLDTWNEFLGAYIYVSAGTVNAGTGWISTAAIGGTLDVTPIPFVQFSSTNSYTAGTGLSLIGSTFSITAPVTVPLGGTGVTTLTGLAYGNGTSAFTAATGAQIAGALSLQPVARASSLDGGSGGQIPYQTGTSLTAFTTTGTAGQILRSGGTGAPTWTTTLPIANGGTNSTATPTAGAVIYGNGTAYAATSAGTSGQVLQSNGSSAPTWVTPSTIYYNVKTYGATGNGSTNDTAAINSAISAATTAGGGTVYFPAGTYQIASTITIGSNITLLGEGRGATTLRGSTNFGDIIQMGDGASNKPSQAIIKSMFITSSVARTTGAAVRMRNGHNCSIEDCSIGYNLSVGVQMDGDTTIGTGGTSSQFIYKLTNFVISTCSNAGVLIGSAYNAGIAGNKAASLVQDVFISNGVIASCTTAGIYLVNVSGLYVSGVDIILGGSSVLTYPGTSQIVSGVFFDSLLADTATGHGFDLITNGGKVGPTSLNNCWGSTCGLAGLRMNTGAGQIENVKITDSTFINNQRQGILIESGNQFNIADCQVISNSMAGSNLYSGIAIGANLSNFSIIGGINGKWGAAGFNNQSYGIDINAGAGNNFIVANTLNISNVTGGVRNLATGPNVSVTGNITA